jgi:hypothetical protein
MGKVCPLCKREQPKAAYTDSGGKVNAKKKKGKAAACNDCKAAGGDCVKLSAAGFMLAGIPDDHLQACYNGVYSKTEQIANIRHVYSGPNKIKAWYKGGRWLLGFQEDIGTNYHTACVQSLAASPESISNNSKWEVAESHENGTIAPVPMRGITTTALNVEALAAATIAVNAAFGEAIEQAAPSFVLSGVDSSHYNANKMGVYERQDEREKVNRRFVYKGPDGVWAWSADCGRHWCLGAELRIGQNISLISAHSCAPAPESIATKHWNVATDDGWQLASLTTTAINHKPAELFEGTCTYCVQCREWRRCGKCDNRQCYVLF